MWWSWQQSIVEVNGIVKTLRLLLLCRYARKRKTFQALALPSNVSCIVAKSRLTINCGLVWRGVMVGTVHFSRSVTADLFDVTIPTKFHPIGHTLQQKFESFKFFKSKTGLASIQLLS